MDQEPGVNDYNQYRREKNYNFERQNFHRVPPAHRSNFIRTNPPYYEENVEHE